MFSIPPYFLSKYYFIILFKYFKFNIIIMSDYDFLNSLKVKILELKKKRDEVTSQVLKDRMHVT